MSVRYCSREWYTTQHSEIMRTVHDSQYKEDHIQHSPACVSQRQQRIATFYLVDLLTHSAGQCRTVYCFRVVQFSTVQYKQCCSVVQYGAVQCSTVQYSTVQYSTVQQSTAQYSTVQQSTIKHSTHRTHRTIRSIHPLESCTRMSLVLQLLLLLSDQARDSTAHRTGRGILDQTLECL